MSDIAVSIGKEILSGIGSVGQAIWVGGKALLVGGNVASTLVIHASAPSSKLIQALSSAPNINSPSLTLLNDMLFYSNLSFRPYTPSSKNETPMVNLAAMNAENLSTEYEQNLKIIITLLGEQQQAYSKMMANPKPTEAEIELSKSRNLAIAGLTQRNKNIIEHCKIKYSTENVEKYCKQIMQGKSHKDSKKLIEIEKKSQVVSDNLIKRYIQNNDPKSDISKAALKNDNLYKQLLESIKLSLLSPLKSTITIPPTQALPQSTQAQRFNALEDRSAAARSQPAGSDKSKVLTNYQTKSTPTNSVSTKTEVTQQQINTFQETIRKIYPDANIQVYKNEKTNTVALTAKSGDELCKAAGEFSKQYNSNKSFKLDSPTLKMALEVLTAAEKNHLIISSVKYQDDQGKTVTVEGKAIQELLKNKGLQPQAPDSSEVTISHINKPK